MEKLTRLSHLLMTVFLSVFASFMVLPAITDVTMSALCPGQDECSLAIYVSGFQQAIIGLGTVVMTPLIGNLSDLHGRKTLLTVPLTLSIIPLVILAYSRKTNFLYAYLVLRTLTAMVSDGSIFCLALAYVADMIPESERASAFGILSGVTSAAWLCGTLATRFLSTASTFQVAALVAMSAVVYMRIFLKESMLLEEDSLKEPILKNQPDLDFTELENQPPKPIFKNIPSVQDLICLLKSSKTFSQAATVSFFQSLSEGGMQTSVMYFLKARFHFNKNQYADIMLIAGIAGTISQLVFVPFVAPAIGEEKLLSVALLLGFTNTFLLSLSWSDWVPYASTVFSIFVVVAIPMLRTIISRQVGPNEQGKAQGCISGISSFANIVSPLIFSPLTALFLSERAPFKFPGFSIMCIGLATMVAFFQSLLIKPTTPKINEKTSNESNLEN